MKNQALFLFSKGVSHIGTRLFTFALSWYILSQTGSGLSFSVSLLVNYLPQIVLSPFAGNLSGKTLRPNRILALCDVASAAVCCLPLFHLGMASIYSTIFLLSAVSAVFNNVIDTHLINLDGVNSAETLKKLTSSAQFITSGVNIIAPSIGGVLIQVCSVRVFAVINIVSFLLSAFGEVWLKYRPLRTEHHVQDAGTIQGNGKTVLSYMFGQKELRTFFIADSLGNFCFSAGVNVALPLIVTTTLGISSKGYGLISSSIAMGSVLCAVWRTKHPGGSRLRYPFLQLGLIGGCMLILALIACGPGQAAWSAAVLCSVMFVVGWLSVDINIKTKTTIQLFVAPDYLSSVLGVSTSISYVLIPMSLVIAGGMSEICPSFILPMVNGILLITTIFLLWRIERKSVRI
ncbi:MAG: MFS transporter [Dysosmobacter sp.]|jgi:DHA3 family macrolide efflux protein-like MFS transporter|nr:MFS transporter [Dysosmobacter sp.]